MVKDSAKQRGACVGTRCRPVCDCAVRSHATCALLSVLCVQEWFVENDKAHIVTNMLSGGEVLEVHNTPWSSLCLAWRAPDACVACPALFF